MKLFYWGNRNGSKLQLREISFSAHIQLLLHEGIPQVIFCFLFEGLLE